MSNNPFPAGFQMPPMPPILPVRPDIAAYIKAFDKPLTIDEKASWLAEIAHHVLQGVIPQEVYPSLRDKIVSLPVATPSKNRPEEKLPGSDYVHDGPPKPYKPTASVFEDAKPMHAYENKQMVRQRDNDSSFFVLLFVVVVTVLGFAAYGLAHWAMKSTRLIQETPQPLAAASTPKIKPVAAKPIESSDQVPQETPLNKATVKLENPFETGENVRFGPELLRISTFKDGYKPQWQDND